ncbi:uncharacterized protein F4822DRAFT_117520 [Hypoxylon trugodes]|uniref:uncharacterized protein n=1 Tax=Hypoxylon trugodes TaxID=326681 RepID=UPI0021967A6B|nr:uncharacterized protein F4822DRAFT_117520 [Hypoxylon trugodes]KAI1392168.1 hypothetical protein F4822DRAFT_117520 [Hypoxylon trugodes]
MKFFIVGFVAALASVVSATAAVEAEAVVNSEPSETRRPPHWPHPSSTTAASSSETTTSFIITITTLPGHPTTSVSAACPTVTHTTRPSECEPFLCPVPGCTLEEELFIPCGCKGVKTALFVDGCQTACPEGCITRLRTVTAACATATPVPFIA